MRIRSKCNWYKYGEKSSNFFLHLGKSRAAQRAVCNITKDKKTLTCHKRINEELFDFYKWLIFRKS